MTKKLSQNIYYLSWLLIAILAVILFRIIKIYDIFCTILSIVSPILFGYIFAWILKPIYEFIGKKLDKRLVILLLLLMFVCIYSLTIWKLIPIVISNLSNLLNILNNYIMKLSAYSVFQNFKSFDLLDMNTIISSCSSVITLVVEFILIHIFGFYILYNYESINIFLKNQIPKKYKKISLEYIRKLSSNMRLYIKGTLLDTAILFVIALTLYSLIGLDYPFILALFSAVTNIIPFVGPYIGGIPAVLVGLSTSINLGFITLAVVVFAQMIESNIINPIIMSKMIKLNPILIITSLTVMSNFFGFIGMIFAVPILIIVKLTLEFLKKYKVIAS